MLPIGGKGLGQRHCQTVHSLAMAKLTPAYASPLVRRFLPMRPKLRPGAVCGLSARRSFGPALGTRKSFALNIRFSRLNDGIATIHWQSRGNQCENHICRVAAMGKALAECRCTVGLAASPPLNPRPSRPSASGRSGLAHPPADLTRKARVPRDAAGLPRANSRNRPCQPMHHPDPDSGFPPRSHSGLA